MKTRLREQQTKLLHRFIYSLQKGTVGKNFDRWRYAVESNKDSATILRRAREEREERRTRLIKRTIARIRYGNLFSAFRSWLLGAQNQRRHRQNLNRAVGRWKFRKAAIAFEQWSDFVEERIHARELMMKVLKRCDNVAVLKAMSTWRGYMLHLSQLKIQKEQLMLRMSNKLASADELNQIIRMVIHEARSFLDADKVTLHLHNKERKVSELQHDCLLFFSFLYIFLYFF